MDTIKVIRKISSSNLQIAELKRFIGKNVEITVTIAPSEKKNLKPKSAAGILSAFKNIEKVSSEKQAWKLAVQEKHGNN